MPDADPFLVSVFHDIGVAMSGDMSLSALTFTELDAYCNRMKTDLTAWESSQIITMSREYCSWNSKGKDKTCTSPWSDNSDEAIEENNARITEKMKALRGRNKAD